LIEQKRLEPSSGVEVAGEVDVEGCGANGGVVDTGGVGMERLKAGGGVIGAGGVVLEGFRLRWRYF
jgi:hypothetical protein